MGLFSTGYDVTQGIPQFTQTPQLAQNLGNADWLTQNSTNLQRNFLSGLQQNYGLNPLQFSTFQNQGRLADQLSDLSQGKGPNPAMAQLAETTGRGMQQQAAMMGSARGAQSNPGMVARQAGQVGANMQQQATGQAATLAAQQQLGAMQQLAAQQSSMANLATAGVGQQQGALSQLSGQNLAYQQMLQNALTQQNQQRLQAQLGQGEIGQAGANNLTKLLGGVLNAGGAMGASAVAAAAKGGVIPDPNGMSILGQHATGMSGGGKVNGSAKVKGDSYSNDTVPAMLSPGEIVIPRSHVGEPDRAAKFLNSLMGWNLKAA